MAKRSEKKNGVAYTLEFRQKVVDRVNDGESQTKVAKETGVSVGSLRNWLGLTGHGKSVRASQTARRPSKRRTDVRAMTTVGVSGDPAIYVLRVELDKAEKRVALLRRMIDALSDVTQGSVAEEFGSPEPIVGPNGGDHTTQPQV